MTTMKYLTNQEFDTLRDLLGIKDLNGRHFFADILIAGRQSKVIVDENPRQTPGQPLLVIHMEPESIDKGDGWYRAGLRRSKKTQVYRVYQQHIYNEHGRVLQELGDDIELQYLAALTEADVEELIVQGLAQGKS